MNVDSPRERWSAAPTRVKMRSNDRQLRARRGHERARLREEDGRRDLAQVRRLTSHVRAGDDEDALFRREVAVVGDERLLPPHRLDDRMPRVRQAEPRARGQLGAGPTGRTPPISREARRRRRRRRRRGRRPRHAPFRRAELGEQLAVDPPLDLADPILRPEDLLLEILQRRRHEPLGVRERLPPDPVGRDAVPVRVTDLEGVAEHAVVTDAQVRDARAFPLLGLDREEGSLRVLAQRAKRVELGVGAVADRAAGGGAARAARERASRPRGARGRTTSGIPSRRTPEPRRRESVAPARDSSGIARETLRPGGDVPGTGGADRDPCESALEIADAVEGFLQRLAHVAAAGRAPRRASQRASISIGSVDGRASASRSARAPSGERVRSRSAQRLSSGDPSEDSKSSSVAIARSVESHALAEPERLGLGDVRPRRRDGPPRRTRARPRRRSIRGCASRGVRGREPGRGTAALGDSPEAGTTATPSGSRTSRGRKSASASASRANPGLSRRRTGRSRGRGTPPPTLPSAARAPRDSDADSGQERLRDREPFPA